MNQTNKLWICPKALAAIAALAYFFIRYSEQTRIAAKNKKALR